MAARGWSHLDGSALGLLAAVDAWLEPYEGRASVRPAAKIHAASIEHNDKQVLGGFEHLHRIAAEVADGGWLTGTTKITQADVTTVVAYTFADTVRPKLGLPQTVPTVIALCSAMRSFAKAPVPPAFN